MRRFGLAFVLAVALLVGSVASAFADSGYYTYTDAYGNMYSCNWRSVGSRSIYLSCYTGGYSYTCYYNPVGSRGYLYSCTDNRGGSWSGST